MLIYYTGLRTDRPEQIIFLNTNYSFLWVDERKYFTSYLKVQIV